MGIWYIFSGILVFICIIVYISSLYDGFEERINDNAYMQTVITNITISTIIFIPTIYFSGILSKLGFPLFKNIIICLLVIDTIYYWTHYISHRIPFIKKHMHSIHHKAVKLLPLDTFFLDIFDYIYYVILTLVLPLLFVENLIEYGIIISISLVHSVYLHSNISDEFILPMFISSKYHYLHHAIGNGNYSIYFTFWDSYMNTQLKEIPKIEKVNSMTMNEFKEHCKNGKKYTVIDNNVIECESWINSHPGGKFVIESLIGNDSTEKFHKIHSDSIVAKEMLHTLKIAEIKN
jgi:sterol desaturase/sphingolipid hydroxylase (fatty acid hydroxylase superfamily)